MKLDFTVQIALFASFNVHVFILAKLSSYITLDYAMLQRPD